MLTVLAWFVRYQRRLGAVTEALVDAEEALDAGDVERARSLVDPLSRAIRRWPSCRRSRPTLLYASGDPLSADALWERAMKKLGAARIAPRLVAAYTALNRAGDARRVAALVPDDQLARITLARCELAAIGGDRRRGRALAGELAGDAAVRSTASGEAMAAALESIAAGHAAPSFRLTIVRSSAISAGSRCVNPALQRTRVRPGRWRWRPPPTRSAGRSPGASGVICLRPDESRSVCRVVST
jgi:hypothetical protein